MSNTLLNDPYSCNYSTCYKDVPLRGNVSNFQYIKNGETVKFANLPLVNDQYSVTVHDPVSLAIKDIAGNSM